MKYKKFPNRRRRREVVLATLLVVVVVGVMVALARRERNTTTSASAQPVQEVPKIRRTLDGVFVEEGKERPPMVGVMVENMDEAQPISGIADANLVFEAVTEANVTRFLALFILGGPASGGPEAGPRDIEIGPVRSARPYFLDWASELDTLYGHVGSSPAAYEMLRKRGVEGVHDLDQWYKDEYYFKKNGRPRPHHLYTNTELLRRAYEKEYTPSESPPLGGGEKTISSPSKGEVRRGFEPWQFKNDAPPDLRGNVSEIKVGYGGQYAVQWLYDKSENHYKRMQWGGTHKDASGKEVITKNIAMAFQEMKVLDAIGRKEFKTIGEGKGLVFQDGRVVVGIWKKPSPRERMRFFDAQGGEVEFNAGVTWVEIVPKDYRATY